MITTVDVVFAICKNDISPVELSPYQPRQCCTNLKCLHSWHSTSSHHLTALLQWEFICEWLLLKVTSVIVALYIYSPSLQPISPTSTTSSALQLLATALTTTESMWQWQRFGYQPCLTLTYLDERTLSAGADDFRALKFIHDLLIGGSAGCNLCRIDSQCLQL